jgi:hypothetical protein
VLAGEEARQAPELAAPAELGGRVGDDGGRDGHAAQDGPQPRAGRGGRGGGRDGLDEALGPGGVGGEVEELERRGVLDSEEESDVLRGGGFTIFLTCSGERSISISV